LPDSSPPPIAAPNKKEEATPPSEKTLSELTSMLGSNDFTTRESAQVELTQLAREFPDATLDPLLKEFHKATAPETRFRLRKVLYRARKAEYTKLPRGFVGIVMNPSVSRLPSGKTFSSVQVVNVVEDSAAQKFGLRLMDQIVSIDGRTFTSGSPTVEFASYISSKTFGDEVELTVQRNQEEKKIKMKLGKRPPELVDPRIEQRFDAEFENWLEDGKRRLKE
jgi:predicted metalloprotease with PDZ domain